MVDAVESRIAAPRPDCALEQREQRQRCMCRPGAFRFGALCGGDRMGIMCTQVSFNHL